MKDAHAANARKNEARAAARRRAEAENRAADTERAAEAAKDATLGLPWDQAAALLKRRASVIARERGITRSEAAKSSECAQLLRMFLAG